VGKAAIRRRLGPFYFLLSLKSEPKGGNRETAHISNF
jgi:hypothetical protein